MPFGYYYDGLSADEASSNDGSEDESSCDGEGIPNTRSSAEVDRRCLHRLVVHADVDCFYCQCEHLDKHIAKDQPLGIGQKHIIVTCNYAARKYGVGKLMLREDALQKCPSLLIEEGSDLERYRKHSRKIYESFRASCKHLIPNVAVRKGCMDEMIMSVEMDGLVDGKFANRNSSTAKSPSAAVSPSDECIYVYGDHQNDKIRLIEDQTGAETTVCERIHPDRTDNGLFQRLIQMASLAKTIRQRILSETGFTVTMGVSINPLLAKLASGLRKPSVVNILEPDRADTLIACMPLRKITGVGSQTVKALEPYLLQTQQLQHSRRIDHYCWTCGDVLKLPRTNVIEALQNLQSSFSPLENGDRLLDLCQGIDTSIVIDDEGGMPKTLSVENSFRRGTVCTKPQVYEHIRDLYQRLPRLFEDRTEWSTNKDRSYPKTIRLTVRVVDAESLTPQHNQRPVTTTKSRQQPFNGQSFLKKPSQRVKLLQESVVPLLHSLLFEEKNFDLTRLNIALTNFQDVIGSPQHPTKAKCFPALCSNKSPGAELHRSGVVKRKRIDDFFYKKKMN